MLKILKRLSVSFFIAVFILNITMLPMAEHNLKQVEASTKTGVVTANNLHIRTKASKKSKCIKVVNTGKQLKILSTGKKWLKVKVGGKVGYTMKKYVSTSGSGSSSSSTKGKAVISYALKFVGNPYRWGGTSLTHGADCSGFVMSVYRHFGKSLPHSSYALRRVGRGVSGLRNAKPGDIICYSGHVALYIGNGKIVHASNARDGIKISSNANYRRIVAIRRIF